LPKEKKCIFLGAAKWPSCPQKKSIRLISGANFFWEAKWPFCPRTKHKGYASDLTNARKEGRYKISKAKIAHRNAFKYFVRFKRIEVFSIEQLAQTSNEL